MVVAQQSISDYEKRKGDFGRVRALIRKILKGSPNLTVEEISIEFSHRYGFLPRIGNRLREDRENGLVVSQIDGKGRKRWRLIDEAKLSSKENK